MESDVRLPDNRVNMTFVARVMNNVARGSNPGIKGDPPKGLRPESEEMAPTAAKQSQYDGKNAYKSDIYQSP